VVRFGAKFDAQRLPADQHRLGQQPGIGEQKAYPTPRAKARAASSQTSARPVSTRAAATARATAHWRPSSVAGDYPAGQLAAIVTHLVTQDFLLLVREPEEIRHKRVMTASQASA